MISPVLLDSACMFFGKLSAEAWRFSGFWSIHVLNGFLLHPQSFLKLPWIVVIVGFGVAIRHPIKTLPVGLSALSLYARPPVSFHYVPQVISLPMYAVISHESPSVSLSDSGNSTPLLWR